MTQENMDVSIELDDIQSVMNRDARFTLQVQNAALNRKVRELTLALREKEGQIQEYIANVDKDTQEALKSHGKKGG
jgi:hypothetical protein